jgi:hypothetical protein
MTEFVQVYGMGDEESRDVVVRPSMSPDRRASLGIPMTSSRTMHGYTMRRDRLGDLRAICDHEKIGLRYNPDPPKWSADECRAGWTRIVRNIDAAIEDLTTFCLSEGWKACGYDTFEELCDEQLHGIRFGAITQRREAVKQMTEAGVSTKTISTALGQDRKTTWRDQRATGVLPPLPRTVSTSRHVPNVPSAQPVEGIVVHPDESVWAAPRRDPAHVMAYQEGMTEVAPPPDLRCVEETIALLRLGGDEVPERVLITLYGLVRSTMLRYGTATP